MSYELIELKEFAPELIDYLATKEISKTNDLISAAATDELRKELVAGSIFTTTQVKDLALTADLLRIPELTPQTVIFFVRAGYKSLDDLKHEDPDLVASKVVESLLTSHDTTNHFPSSEDVINMVQTAHDMSPLVT